MADLRDILLTSEQQQIAAELMAAVDIDTLGGGDVVVDRTQSPQRDEIDPGTLMSAVHSGSYTPGEEIGTAPLSPEFAGLEYDLGETDLVADDAPDHPEVAALGPTPDAEPIEEAFDDAGPIEEAFDDAEDLGGEESVPFGNTLLNTGCFENDDGDEVTIDLPAEQGGDGQESQPNFADAPVLTTSDASGDENSAIDLDIASALTDASESLSITISGVPAGASLSAGTDNGDGTWTLTQAQLAGLTLMPPADSDADFTLTVTATSTDDSDTAQTVDTFDVFVAAVADAPTLAAAVSGNEDTAIVLDIK